MSYSMQLADILALLNVKSDDNSLIQSLTVDSRTASADALFIAYPGGSADGRDYIEQAQEAGASAVLFEAEDFVLPTAVTIPAFGLHGLQSMVGVIANTFYRAPSSEMQVFGVTGTNGKTTCCYLLTQALRSLGLEAAMIGTIGVGKLNQLDQTSHTTPDPISIHRLLAEFRDQGVTQVCMEVSSHALDQGRVNGVEFFCGLFTNLSHDHLDYHGDMQAYGAAKLRLFTDFHHELVVTNLADRLGASIMDVARADFFVRYGRGGDIYADDVSLGRSGINMVIEGNGVEFEIASSLVGQVNVPNLELLVATLLGLSTPVDEIQRIIAELEPAPGRMELYTADESASVVVDYAHTPDALEKALLSIEKHCTGQLWCVFGCGGDRDKDKRPVMGAAAEKYADKLIVTNDNPRSEKGEDIAADIVQGIHQEVQIILNRAEAIDTAIAQASPQDWVLIAGKGHESTQQVGGEYLPFSDREYVARALGCAV